LKIKINLLKKPNKKLRSALYAYSVLSRAKAYCNQQNVDLLVGLSFVNKDLNYVLDNIDNSRRICTKLISDQKLTKNEEKFVSCSMKLQTTNKEVDLEYFKIIENYKKEIIPKIENRLKELFTDTNVDLKIIFLYQPLVETTKGSAFTNGVLFSVENKNINEERFYRLITHEIIHCICDHNKEYQELYGSKKLNIEKLRDSRRIFNEVFTKTIENVLMHKLKLEKDLFANYRYEGAYNDLACKMENNIRSLYLKWQKSSKETFVCFLKKNVEKIVNL